MIYKILGKDVSDASQFIIFSFDGTYALVRSEIDIDGYIEKYPETELSNLYRDPLFRQPCKDCEV